MASWFYFSFDIVHLSTTTLVLIPRTFSSSPSLTRKMIFHNFHVEAEERIPPFLNYGRFRIPFLKMAWRCWWRLLWEKQRTQNTKSKNLLVASLDCLILSSPLGDIDPFASKIASVALLFYPHNFTSYSFATMIFARFAVALALCASTSAFM